MIYLGIDKEIWKDIKGYKGLYQISNFGNVRSNNLKNRKCSIIMKGEIDKDGYHRVNILDKKYFVHRLVLQHFGKKIKNKNEVNHIDGDKRNNHISNLEWVNRKENIKHSWKNGLQKNIGVNHPKAKLNMNKAKKIRELYNKDKKKYSYCKLAKKYNVDSKTIWSVVNNETWKEVV